MDLNGFVEHVESNFGRGKALNVELIFANSSFPWGFPSISYLIKSTLHLMTSNLEYTPLVDIIQDHFHKSLEVLINIWGCGLRLTVHVVI